jgi:monofunctional chorismate mutase
MTGGGVMIRAIRGAICAKNSKESIAAATKELLNEIFKANDLEDSMIIAITFTCTKDLNAAYPAAAAREMGLVNASLMCMTEMDVQGALPGCIRVQILAQMDNIKQDEIKHIYLGKAKALRPDFSPA